MDTLQSELDSYRRVLEKEKNQLNEFKENFKPFLNELKAPKKRVGFVASPSPQKSSGLPHLSPGEFESLPKYLRGRLPVTRVNSFIDVLNRIVDEKYSILLRTNPAKLSVEQRQRVSEWRAAESIETANKLFITEADLKAKSGAGGSFKFDQVARNILTILRQVGRIKESRSVGIIRYIFE